MKKNQDILEEEGIEILSIYAEKRKWIMKNLSNCKRKQLHFVFLILVLITLATTALSMAKYAVTNSTEQLVSFNSNKFIWSSNLVTTGVNNKETITGEPMSKVCYTLVDAYVPFQIKNYETANGVMNINLENIDYRISVEGDIEVLNVTDPYNPKDATLSNNTMIKNYKMLEEFKIVPASDSPGTYSGVVTVESLLPYVKKYVRNVTIEMKDTEVNYRDENTKLFVEIQNGIKDSVVVEFNYDSPIYEIDVNVPVDISVQKKENELHRTARVKLPAGTKIIIQFQASGVDIHPSDVPYTIQ